MGRFELQEDFISQDRFITSDKFFELAVPVPGLTYIKREFIYGFGTWRGYNIGPIFLTPRKVFDRVLIIGSSDISLKPSATLILRAMGVRKIYGTNTLPYSNFVESLPLGLTNFCDDSPLHRIFGNPNHFRMASQSSNFLSEFSGSVYANFSTWTFTRERSPLKASLQKLKHVILEEMSPTEEGRISFLRKLRENSFVITPRGNGVDTHRLWETLYMGGIPIIRKDPMLKDLVKDLPVLVVDDWRQIHDLKFLERSWYEIRSKTHRFEKLDIDYWKKKILLEVNPRRLSW